MEPIAEAHGAAVYHGPWQFLRANVPRCDAVIVDAPYSEKTHGGHDDGIVNLNTKTRGEDYRASVVVPTGGTGPRRAINYDAWTAEDVRAFVDAWHPICDGWIVSITDHILAPEWVDALDAAGRYVFAPLPYVAPGSRVRLSGDGPSCWTTWIVVGRPRTREYSTWGTLPGAYVLPEGQAVRMPVVGGKPPWLMTRLCEDYSRPGGLVVDPCCGAGTLGIGAIRTGRRAILGDLNREHVDLAAQWIRNPYAPPPGTKDRTPEGQLSLIG
jgi:hypothetical protein